MKIKSSLAVISLGLAIVAAGCSQKSTSSANTDSTTSNTNATATAPADANDNTTLETKVKMADDSSTNPSEKSRTPGKMTKQEKTANANTPGVKRAPEKTMIMKSPEEGMQSTGKQMIKKGERVLLQPDGPVKEGQRKVMKIFTGKPPQD
jgi:hypothetical protein